MRHGYRGVKSELSDNLFFCEPTFANKEYLLSSHTVSCHFLTATDTNTNFSPRREQYENRLMPMQFFT